MSFFKGFFFFLIYPFGEECSPSKPRLLAETLTYSRCSLPHMGLMMSFISPGEDPNSSITEAENLHSSPSITHRPTSSYSDSLCFCI